MITLDKLKMNKKATIRSLQNHGTIKRRLLDLGILHGVEIQPMLCSPSKNMRAFLIKGTLIALREEESSLILVEEGN